MSFLNEIISSSGNEYASTVIDGLEGSDINGFCDTGSYSFNALLSGSVFMVVCLIIRSYGNRRRIGYRENLLSLLGIVHKFLVDNPDGVVLIF